MPIQFLRIFNSSQPQKRLSCVKTKAKLIELDQLYESLKKAMRVRETSIEMMIRLMGKYSFNHDTLFIAVQLLDQLIEMNFQDPIDDPELIAGVLILIATKYNEVYPVVIDQINLNITKYYDREVFYQLEGLILEKINFQIPSSTAYSEIYNSLAPAQEQRTRLSKKQKSESSDTDDCSEKDFDSLYDRKNLGKELLQVLRELEVFKHGKEFLLAGLLSYFKKEKVKGLSSNDIKVHQIKLIVKKFMETKNDAETLRSPRMTGTKLPQIKGKKIFTEKRISSNICCF